MDKKLADHVILIKGAGEMATGVACRLFGSNLRRILLLETETLGRTQAGLLLRSHP